MRNCVAFLTVASAALLGAPAVQACDMEGFGITRINPFGQHAAWNVPKDPPNQQSENSAVLSASARKEADRSAAQDATAAANYVQPTENSAAKAFASSQVTSAEQAKRFTATKD